MHVDMSNGLLETTVRTPWLSSNLRNFICRLCNRMSTTTTANEVFTHPLISTTYHAPKNVLRATKACPGDYLRGFDSCELGAWRRLWARLVQETNPRLGIELMIVLYTINKIHTILVEIVFYRSLPALSVKEPSENPCRWVTYSPHGRGGFGRKMRGPFSEAPGTWPQAISGLETTTVMRKKANLSARTPGRQKVGNRKCLLTRLYQNSTHNPGILGLPPPPLLLRSSCVKPVHVNYFTS